MLKITSLLFILGIQVLLACSQDSYPEAYDITGFPSQNQTIYGGWIEANSSTRSLLYYNLYSKDNTDINSTSNNASVPLIVYLEGGPGDPSTFTAFTEIGPYVAHADDFSFTNITLQNNPNSFAKNYHLLVIDQPVGTGFSIRRNKDTVISSDQAAENLITFFTRLYELYPGLQDLPTYFYGHSYGGKWVPTLLYKWLEDDRFSGIDIAGVIIGNGFIDQKYQYKSADFAYNLGILNRNQRDTLLEKEAEVSKLHSDNNWVGSTLVYNEIQSCLQNVNVSGGVWGSNLGLYLPPPEYNLTVPLEYMGFVYVSILLSNSSSEIRSEILKIPENVNFSNLSPEVQGPLVENGDFGNSTTYAIENILNQEIPLLLYTGQFDGGINYPGIMDYLSEVDWEGIPQFLEANKSLWYADEVVAGSYQNYENLYLAVVNKAGHFCIYDQGPSIIALLDLFVNATKS